MCVGMFIARTYAYQVYGCTGSHVCWFSETSLTKHNIQMHSSAWFLFSRFPQVVVYRALQSASGRYVFWESMST